MCTTNKQTDSKHKQISRKQEHELQASLIFNKTVIWHNFTEGLTKNFNTNIQAN